MVVAEDIVLVVPEDFAHKEDYMEGVTMLVVVEYSP